MTVTLTEAQKKFLSDFLKDAWKIANTREAKRTSSRITKKLEAEGLKLRLTNHEESFLTEFITTVHTMASQKLPGFVRSSKLKAYFSKKAARTNQVIESLERTQANAQSVLLTLKEANDGKSSGNSSKRK